MTAIPIVEDDILANEHLEFILQHAGYEDCPQRAPTRRRSCLKVTRTSRFSSPT
jgi:hypothetical protein